MISSFVGLSSIDHDISCFVSSIENSSQILNVFSICFNNHHLFDKLSKLFSLSKLSNAPDVISKSIVFSPIPFVLNKRIVGTRPSNFLLGKEFLREIILSLIEAPIPFMQLKPNMIEPSLIEYVSTD